jgi:hypothetical protein
MERSTVLKLLLLQILYPLAFIMVTEEFLLSILISKQGTADVIDGF